MSHTKKKVAKKAPKKKSPPSKALAVVKQEPAPKQSTALSLANPQDVLNFGKVLKSYIATNKLSTKIQGNDYAHVDGWKFAGMNFGLTAIPHKPVAKHLPGQYVTVLYAEKEFQGKQGKYKKDVAVFVGYSEHTDIIEQVRAANKITKEQTKPYFAYECEVDIVRINDGQRVSYGVGFCSNLEMLKTGFDEYSVNSMAQTRAIGKGFRNLLGFVMNAAGIEGTPMEEMDEVDRHNQENNHWEPEPPKNKPRCSDFHFKQILSRIQNGQHFDMEEASQHFTFTQEQQDAIKTLLTPPTE